jgi:flagellin
MLIANTSAYNYFVTDYHMQSNKLQEAMLKLSSGDGLIVPGEKPADLSISERFRTQIGNSKAAADIIQNATNMFQTADSWLQQVQDILNRMSELAISAQDGSKNVSDRQNLDTEYQQLKAEISRISEAGKYNGLATNSKTAAAVYDTVTRRIVFTQPDGTNKTTLNIDLGPSATDANGVLLGFTNAAGSNVGDFFFTPDGKNLVYVAQQTSGGRTAQKSIVKLNLETLGTASVDLTQTGGTIDMDQVHFTVDDVGRVWVTDSQGASGIGNANMTLLNLDSMTLDKGGTTATNKWVGGVTSPPGWTPFAVSQDYAYFVKAGPGLTVNFVKQSIYSTGLGQTLVSNLTSQGMVAGNTFAVSQDGQYIAFEGATTGVLNIINTTSGLKTSTQVGNSANSIVGLQFDANNNVYWTDTGAISDDNALKRASITTGATPTLINTQTLYQAGIGHLGVSNAGLANKGGLSVSGGGSPSSNYTFQVGPDPGMNVEFTSADLRIASLSISNTDVLSAGNATNAVKQIASAVDEVGQQRAIIGSEVSRLSFIFAANQGYINNISSAEARIRTVDYAQQAALLAQAQIGAQASQAVLAQFNTFSQGVLRFFQ